MSKVAMPMVRDGGVESKDADELKPSPELVTYYREKVAQFEKEREELIARIDAVGVRRAELHQSEWELKKRTMEVSELQKALSDAHAYLFEERDRLMTMQAENDDLKLKEVEDRKRIENLLKAMDPTKSDITLSRDPPPVPPQAMSGQLKGVREGSKDSEFRMRDLKKKFVLPSKKNKGGGKTVYMPGDEDGESSKLKIQQLETMIVEQRKFANERIATLLEDRRIRDADEALIREAADKKVVELEDRLKRTEELLQQSTKDYILLRTTPYILHEQQQLLNAELESLSGERESLDGKVRHARKDAKKRAEAEVESYIANLRDQLQRRSATATQYERRISELESQNANYKKKHREIETRRAMDLEGFTADVTTLRRLLAAVDRKLHQTRLTQRLDDDERLDMLMEQLEKRAPDPAPAPGGAHGGVEFRAKDGPGMAAPLDAKGVAFDVQHIRKALSAVEERLSDARVSAAAVAGQTAQEIHDAGKLAAHNAAASARAAGDALDQTRDYYSNAVKAMPRGGAENVAFGGGAGAKSKAKPLGIHNRAFR
jgi:coiled-coil domain-containing protein 77